MDTTITPTAGGAAVPLATAQITVEGATLTMNGRHTIASLAVVRNGANQPGVLTHTQTFTFDYPGVGIVNGLWLNVNQSVFVQGADGSLVASRVDVNGRGFGSEAGPGVGASGSDPGGGGHGGAGANGLGGWLGGSTYGSFATPVTMGSGGGRDTNNFGATGGNGGGVVRVVVLGTLTVDGIITANGTTGTGATDASGGAGGSIIISAGILNGAGLITANGGASLRNGGSGGGGRVAVYADASTFDDIRIRAYGGDLPANVGGAGTVYRRLTASSPETLVIDNGNLPFTGAITEISGEVEVPQHMLIRNNGRIGPPRLNDTLALTVLGNATVASGGLIFADGRGFGSEAGPGVGASGSDPGGGGHGGAGANGLGGWLGGSTYGSFATPVTMGSGGGRDTNNFGATGGNGGGVVRVVVLGTLTVDGIITANGTTGTGATDASGGAGGSIIISAGILNGAGLITANGGASLRNGGSGGGGRVAVYADASTFDDIRIRAYGGDLPANVGGAGTVYRRLTASSPETLVIDNGNLPFTGAITEISGEVEVPQHMLIRNNGRIGPPRLNDTLALTVLGNATVASGGLIFADGRGFGSEAGPGVGASGSDPGGGGHGGAGANGLGGWLGGSTYGSFATPVTMGSGGGRDTNNFGATGGNGGGVVRVVVLGTLTVDGIITANGTTGTGATDASGGAGGSIIISAGILNGAGLITANGGASLRNGGSGGGGRVAVYADASTFDDIRIRAYGGDLPANVGGAGTVYRRLTASSPETLVIDNGNLPFTGAITEISGEVEVPQHMLIRNNGRIGPPRLNDTLALTVLGNATVASGGLIFADGRGFGSEAGPGVGASGSDPGGGGHGGAGANGLGGWLGGSTYGSFATPVTMGSGGGRDTNNFGATGGNGGGVVRVVVLGTLTVDGIITANGTTGTGATDASGGAGGSIIISAGILNGAGLITANGGASLRNGGSGGGGRVAVYACDFDMMLEQVIASGNVGTRPGEDGTIYFGTLGVAPGNVRACLGSTVTLAVVAQAGGVSNGYQWYFNGIELEDGITQSGSFVSGSSTDMLTIEGVTLEDNGQYTCVSDGLCGTGESNPVEVSICGSDYNCDGITDILDLLGFLDDFGSCTNLPAPCGLGNPDVLADGFIDILDLLEFLQYFGGGC
ncbi:MAG: immunoglobulin domain-containing protein [Phycisphaeraceae bacterium]|nr:immunoglobulin domain-containing protein [Phycisphaeraceae bacterium]